MPREKYTKRRHFCTQIGNNVKINPYTIVSSYEIKLRIVNLITISIRHLKPLNLDVDPLSD